MPRSLHCSRFLKIYDLMGRIKITYFYINTFGCWAFISKIVFAISMYCDPLTFSPTLEGSSVSFEIPSTQLLLHLSFDATLFSRTNPQCPSLLDNSLYVSCASHSASDCPRVQCFSVLVSSVDLCLLSEYVAASQNTRHHATIASSLLCHMSSTIEQEILDE